jgi:hypothetical protein
MTIHENHISDHRAVTAEQASRMRALWLAVIEENMRIACGGAASSVKPHEVASAIEWFDSLSLVHVCELAGVHPEDVRRVFDRRREEWLAKQEGAA